jgi:hypothetical protein
VKLVNGADANTAATGPELTPGAVVTWTYSVSNPGTVPLANVTVTDDNGTPGNAADDVTPLLVGGDVDGDLLLDPGETWTYSATGTVGTAEYCNTGTASGTNGTTATATDPACYRLPVVTPVIAIVKLVNDQDANDLPAGPLLQPGAPVTWTYSVTNGGTVGLANVVVRDDNGTADITDDFIATFTGGDTNSDGLLGPGETWRYSATGTVGATDYCNTGSSSGDANGTTAVASDPACYRVPVVTPVVAAAVLKLVDGQDANTPASAPLLTPGAPVTWTYVLTNPGTVPLANVVMRDDNGTGDTADDFSAPFIGGDTDADGLLDPGETWTYAATGTVGTVDYCNTGTASGDGNGTTAIARDPACYRVAVVPPVIAIVKVVNGQDANDAAAAPVLLPGATVTWTYTVTNPGTMPLANVTVTDDNGTGDPADDFSPTFTGGDTDGDGVLDPGETWTYSATGIVGTLDYCNAGTATGDGNGTTASATDAACYVALVTPVIAVVKSVNGEDANTPASGPVLTSGAAVTWTYSVANPGMMPLANVTVTDDNGTGDTADDFLATFTSGDTNGDGLLDPGENWTYSATGTVGALQYCNVATASGTNGTTATASDRACYRVPPPVAIAIVKLVNGEDANAAAVAPVLTPGAAVTWTYSVTNPGTAPLTSVVVRDDNGTPDPVDDFSPTFTGGDTDADGVLDPGETWTYSATGTVGTVDYCNTGAASGDGNGTTAVASDPACYRVPVVTPVIAIVKLVDGQDANDLPAGPVLTPGAAVTWTYSVTNPGPVPLASVTVTDDNGTLVNAADDLSPAFTGGDTDGDGLLDPGETWTYSATGTVGAVDYCNTGTASGDADGTTAVASDPACYRVPVVAPVIAIVKLVDGQDANNLPAGPVLTPGAAVTWTYSVTNPGTMSLANVTVSDDNGTPANAADDFIPTLTGGDTDGDGLLDPGETWTYSATGTVGGADYCNAGTASGTNGTTATATNPACYRVPPVVPPVIAIGKLVNGEDANTAASGPELTPGAPVTWTYVVTNPGTVSLGNVTVTDDNGTSGNAADDFGLTFAGGDTNGDGLLDPGETWTYSATGTVGALQYCNVGTASGTNRTTATASDPACYRVRPVVVDIDVVKLVEGQDANTAAAAPVLTPGAAVTWTYSVTNPGTVSLSGVVVRDNNGTPDVTDDFDATLTGGDANGDGLLDPGETWTYSATGTVGAVGYCNTGTASGSGNGRTAVATDPACYSVPVVTPVVAAAVLKLVNGQDANTPASAPVLLPGAAVTWTYVVSNPGTVSLANVTVTDDNGTSDTADDYLATLTGGDTDGDGLLDPGETWTYSATGTVGAVDYCNVGTATGAGNGTTLTAKDPACYRVPVVIPAIAITKLVNNQDADDPASGPVLQPGTTVTWTYSVTNPGTVPLTNVVVRDDNGTADPADDFSPTSMGGDTDGDGLLDPGETWTSSATRTVGTLDYCNTGTASGDGNGITATATDPACYRVPVATPVPIGISLVKLLNAYQPLAFTTIEDANVVRPQLVVGGEVIFTYVVTNTGGIRLAVDKATGVVDDNATPNNPADDFFATYVAGDTNNDGWLDSGETWIFRSPRLTAKAGTLTNTARVTGGDPTSGRTTSDSDTATYRTAGMEGHTPGFWKTNVDTKNAIAWPRDAAGNLVFDPNQLASTLFTGLPAPYASLTLSEALGGQGGGIAALVRHAISGVLNATHPDIAYPLSVTQIIDLVNTALASGDRNRIEQLKNLLASYNELGSDLDANGRAAA